MSLSVQLSVECMEDLEWELENKGSTSPSDDLEIIISRFEALDACNINGGEQKFKDTSIPVVAHYTIEPANTLMIQSIYPL